MDKVMITGGAGFIGSSVARALLSLGHPVLCVDNFFENYDIARKKENISHLETLSVAKENFCFIQADICDRTEITAILKNHHPDVVIHLAAIPGVAYSVINPDIYQKVNVDGTKTLLNAMKNVGISRLVFASSSSVYGNLPAPFFETASLVKGISPYAETKRQGELLVQAYPEITSVILRLFSVYGPCMRPDLAMSIFTDKIMHASPIQIFGNGSSARDYTYISDAVDGIIKAMHYTTVKNDIFNISGAKPIQLCDLIAMLEEKLNKKAILNFENNRPFESVCTHAELSKSKQILGYAPKIDIHEGLDKTLRYLLSHMQKGDIL